MSELKAIMDVARKVLQIRTVRGDIDNSFWDRAQRLERSVDHICPVPEILEMGFQIDRFCLTAASYFVDAGLAQSSDRSKDKTETTFLNLNVEDSLESAVQIVEEKLGSFINRARIRKTVAIISECGNHFTRMPEAMILSDARNLDDMGAVGIFKELRQQIISGKSISEVLQNWKRKVDYKYWEARLKESFRFESVRRLAEKRLFAAEQFMNQLGVENTAEDLAGLIAEYVETEVAVTEQR